MRDDALEEVLGLLVTAVERLDELAYDLLAEAVAAGETARPELERRIVRARNTLERAAALLRDDAGRDEAP